MGARRKSKGKGNNANKKRQQQPVEPSSESSVDRQESSEESEPENELRAGQGSVQKPTNAKKKDQLMESSDDSSDGPEEDTDDAESEDEGEQGQFFTDENAQWLKPKKKKSQLMESSDEEEEEEEDDDDELLEIEKEARMNDEELEMEQEEADDEMRRTVKEHTSVYHLPTPEELEKDADRVVPPSEIRSHIESILEVLADFKSRREPGRSRKEYVDQLCAFISELYGYLPELVEYFLTMFSAPEALEFVDSSDKPRPLVIRTNTLKARRKDLAAALIKRGVSLDPLANWSKVGLKIVESPVPIGATPEYLSGMYMLQSAASMCPVMALSPEPQEKVLDMSAAPGGKTSYMAQLMRNTGVIFANDLKPERQKATVANMHRLGVKNVVVCAHDGRKLGHMFKNRFDRVLLDAPCSGLGVISRDPSVKVQRTMADVLRCGHLQKELLLAAIDALKWRNTTGGVMVYSTCSVSVAENEEVINYALSKRDIKLIDTGLDFGKPGFTRYQNKRFHPSVSLTRRFYPHVHNMDGFFVAKIQKLSDRRPDDKHDGDASAEQEESIERKEEAQSPKKENVSVDTGKNKKKRKEQELTEKSSRKVSVPPAPAQAVSKKKQKTSAKTSKPRRIKISSGM